MAVFRTTWRVFLGIADLVNEFLDKNGPHLAAAITYYSLISLFPLTVTVMSVVSFFDPTPMTQERMALTFSTLLPVPQETFHEFYGTVTRNKHVLGAVGIFGLLWTSTTVFSAIRKGMNSVWGIHRPRPFFQERLIDLALVTGAGVLMMVPMVATAVLGYLGEASEPLLPSALDPALFIVRVVPLLGPVVSSIIFTLLYMTLPNTTVPFRDVWPVAVLSALVFEGARLLFLWYAHTFPVYNNVVYGSVGALIGFLTWVYVSAIVLLFGALVAARHSRGLARWIERRVEVVLKARRRVPVTTPKRKQHISETIR